MTQEQEKETDNELLTLLGSINLAEVEDLPDYIVPPAGKYALRVVSAKPKKITVKKGTEDERSDIRLTITLEIINTIQLNNEMDEPAKDLDLFSLSFLICGKGVAYAKKFIKPLISEELLTEGKWTEIFTALNGKELTALVSVKTDGEFTNVNLSNVELAD